MFLKNKRKLSDFTLKERADLVLYNSGLADSREKAKRIIMEGSVYLDEVRIDKPGEKIPKDSKLTIRDNPIKYVSRGGLKLEKAIENFNINLQGLIAMDIGASTGGFTDCMLQNGASKVYALDVGYGQLDWKLRNDDRVVVMERTNIRDVEKNDIEDDLDFISIDVSFISLELVLPVAKELLKEEGSIVALIKPQFEAGRDEVGPKGVIRDKKIHLKVLKKIVDLCEELDLSLVDLTYSPITGAKGNIEFICKIVQNRGQSLFEDKLKSVVIEASENL